MRLLEKQKKKKKTDKNWKTSLKEITFLWQLHRGGFTTGVVNVLCKFATIPFKPCKYFPRFFLCAVEGGYKKMRADLGGGCRGCAPPPWDDLRFSNTTGILQKKLWFIGVEVEQETSAPPPKKNPGSAPDSAAKKEDFSPFLSFPLCCSGASVGRK